MAPRSHKPSRLIQSSFGIVERYEQSAQGIANANPAQIALSATATQIPDPIDDLTDLESLAAAANRRRVAASLVV
jgi:hypothetical protein